MWPSGPELHKIHWRGISGLKFAQQEL